MMGQHEAQCPNHDSASCCTSCTDRKDADAWGFPDGREVRTRRPLRQCPLCGHFTSRGAWHHDVNSAVFCCKTCAPGAYERIAQHLIGKLRQATGRNRVNLQIAIDEALKRARKVSAG
jgi:hypothetical protein